LSFRDAIAFDGEFLDEFGDVRNAFEGARFPVDNEVHAEIRIAVEIKFEAIH